MAIIKFDKDIREGIKNGVDELANAVKVTLGPKGRNVIIKRNDGSDPQVTKDGVTVAKAIELKDAIENMGATVVKRVAEKSNDNAGDGTTTATVLTQAILTEGLKLVAAGFDPIEMKKGIDYATERIIEELNAMAIPVKSDSKEVEQIATVSANNDGEVGKMVADAFNSVGTDGAVSVEAGSGFKTVVHKIDGLQFDRGMASTYFSTSPEKAEVSMINPLIIIVDGKLTTTEQAMAILEPVTALGRGLIVIADDISGNALSALILNKMRGGHQICAIQTPGFGDFRKDLAKDIAAITGAQVVPENMVEDISSEYVDQLFGTAKNVKVEQMSTIIMGGDRDEAALKVRLDLIASKLKDNKITKYEVQKLEERKAKLSGGVAVIDVGAKSEIDMKELKDRYDDAKEAVCSALEEGVVIGGGCALLSAKSKVMSQPWPNNNRDFETGVDILLKAIESPFRTICKNANVSADVKIESVKKHGRNYGYNAKTDKFTDMVVEGILDPKKVTRIALESAASVAGTLLTTQCAVIEE